MFTLLKIVGSVIVVLVIAGAVIYFLPADIKLKALNAVTNVLPESVREKTENLLLTPPQQRERIIQQLRTNLETISHASSSQLVDNVIEYSQELIVRLEEKNEEQSLTEIVAHQVAQRLVHQTAGTSTRCQN